MVINNKSNMLFALLADCKKVQFYSLQTYSLIFISQIT